MSFVAKSFNEVADYMKKLEGVKKVVQAKALSKKSQNVGNFSNSYSRV